MPGPVFPVRAVLLDGADTLLALREPAEGVYKRVAERHGIRPPIAELAVRHAGAMRRFRRPPPEGVALSRIPRIEQDAWRAVVAASLGPKAANGPVFEELWRYYGTPEAWRLADGVLEALDRIRETGVRTAVVSNMDSRLPGLLGAFDLARRLDVVAIPSTVGLAKPDPRIFRAALARLNAHPFEARYIGDREEDCLSAARAAGIPSIRYDPSAERSDPQILVAWSDLPARVRGEA
jgi:putative hydrolase of the HAD superfamily